MRWKPTKKYFRGVEALYGVQRELDEPVIPKKNKIKLGCPLEKQEHFAAHYRLIKMGIKHHHSPNGGYRDAREGAVFKRMGTSAGFPDFEIPYARKGYHGLYIELKRIWGGVLSDPQKEWRDYFVSAGYCWYMAQGADDLIRFVENYFE